MTRSASVVVEFAPLRPFPTAVQALLELHDTPLNPAVAPTEPEGNGVCWIDHRDPLRPSASG